MAVRALNERLQRDVLGAAPVDLLKGNGAVHLQVSAPLGLGLPAPAAAAAPEDVPEDITEDVPEVTAAEAALEAAACALLVGINALIVHLALLRMGEDVVGLVHFLELGRVLLRIIRMAVRMVLDGSTLERLLYFLVARVFGDAQYLIIVFHDICSSGTPRKRSPLSTP